MGRGIMRFTALQQDAVTEVAVNGAHTRLPVFYRLLDSDLISRVLARKMGWERPSTLTRADVAFLPQEAFHSLSNACIKMATAYVRHR